MSVNKRKKNKPGNIKIKTKKTNKLNKNDDIIEEGDFENTSDDKENEDKHIEEEGQEDEEQEEENDDLLENEDYGDEEQKDNDEEPENEYEQEEKEGDNCLYKFAKKINNESEDEEDEDGDDNGNLWDDEMESRQEFIVKNEDRETKPILTKYERVRILGDRAKQLALGAKPMLLNVNNMNPKEIAKLELERGVIPFIIEKPLPDGRLERWKVSELKIVN